MSAQEDVVGGKLRLKREAPDGSRKKKLHKKHHQDQSSLVTENEKEHAADSKEKESDVRQETVYVHDDFLGKKVPDTGEIGGCAVCGKWDHYHGNCPCLKYFPKGTVIGPFFETMCRRCDRIGEVCCDKGGYAMKKRCGFCGSIGHWEWEDSENCCRPKEEVFEKPAFFNEKKKQFVEVDPKYDPRRQAAQLRSLLKC